MANNLFSLYQKNELATNISIIPIVMNSFLLEARSCQTKKLPWGRSRFALLPKFHGCRTRSKRINLTKELRGKSWDHGNWCARLRNSFQLGPLEQFFTVPLWYLFKSIVFALHGGLFVENNTHRDRVKRCKGNYVRDVNQANPNRTRSL